MIVEKKLFETKQPKALYLLAFVRMWECFSFYGMRTLLVLYMLKQLHFSDLEAFATYAVYTGLVELGGVVGGFVADSMLGLRRTITLGGIFIAAGHLTLAIREDTLLLFLGLSMIVVGSSLFSTNIAALLGLFYSEDDARREAGFTLFYVGMNVGGLLAALLCGIVGELYGWHYGFGLAAAGMLVGNVVLYSFCALLEGKGKTPTNSQPISEKNIFLWVYLAVLLVAAILANASALIFLLPFFAIAALGYVIRGLLQSKTVSPSKVWGLLLYIGALVLFFATEEQIGSTLVVFTERMTIPRLFGIDVSPSILLSINPLTIILLGSLITRMCSSRRQRYIPRRMVYAFIMASAAFAALAFVCLRGDGEVPMLIVMGAVFLISFAELLIGPLVYSYCSIVASESGQSSVMSVVSIGFSLANFLAGFLSRSMAITEDATGQSLSIYGAGFTTIAILLGFAAIALGLVLPTALYIFNLKPKESLV